MEGGRIGRKGCRVVMEGCMIGREGCRVVMKEGRIGREGCRVVIPTCLPNHRVYPNLLLTTRLAPCLQY